MPSAESAAGDVPGWNSLKQVMIIIGVEERSGIRLSSSEMHHIACVSDFPRLTKAKAGVRQSPVAGHGPEEQTCLRMTAFDSY